MVESTKKIVFPVQNISFKIFHYFVDVIKQSYYCLEMKSLKRFNFLIFIDERHKLPNYLSLRLLVLAYFKFRYQIGKKLSYTFREIYDLSFPGKL